MLTFDLRDFERAARFTDRFADQIPFALARALNDGADVTVQKTLPQVWAENIRVRNPNFLKQALSTRGTRATKRNLRVEVFDRFGRGNLKAHDKGGTARAKHGVLAIPTAKIMGRRGSHGMPKGLQPRNLSNSFSKIGNKGDLVIYQRTGKYQKATKTAKNKARKSGEKRPKGVDNRHVKLVYVTKPSNPVRADVPFSREFERTMRREVKRAFSVRIREAMATARRR